MNNPIVKWGVYLGVASIAFTLALYLINKEMIFSGYVSTIGGLTISVLFIALAMKEVRTINDGYLGYGEAVKTGLLTYVLGAFLVVIFSFVLYNVIDTSLFELEKQKSIEIAANMADTFGMDEDMKEEMIAQTQEQVDAMGDNKGISSFLLEFLMSGIWGLILSLIIGAFMKKSS